MVAAITISEYECFAEVLSQPLQATAGHGVLTCVYQVNFPVFMNFATPLGLAATKIDTEIRRRVRVLHEVAFDDFALVTQGNDELVEALLRESLHQMP